MADNLMNEIAADEIRKADDVMLLRMPVTQDLGSVVEANIRLRKSSERLAAVTNRLTWALVAMTAVLCVDAITKLIH